MSIEIAPLRAPLRVALIGTGTMGCQHLQASTRLPNAPVVARAGVSVAPPMSTAERRIP